MTSLVQLAPMPAIPGVSLDPTSNVDLLSFPTVTQPAAGLGMGAQTPAAPAPAPPVPADSYSFGAINQPAQASQASTSSSSSGGNLSTPIRWFDSIVARALTPDSWLSLEDLIFIVIGILLIAAAAFGLAFHGAETVVNAAGRGAGRVERLTRGARRVATTAAETAAMAA